MSAGTPVGRPPREAQTARNRPPEASEDTRRVSSEVLFAGAPEVLIEHRGLLYRLRHTALGKLILTK